MGSLSPPVASARTRLLEAARRLIRRQGFAATSVDALCAEAGVTKGAFFHHFASKEALGVAAVEFWNEATGALFAAAPYHALTDPLDRVLAYIDFRIAMLEGEVSDFTCLIGTIVQEAYQTSPAIRAACDAGITGHASALAGDIEAAIAGHGVKPDWTAESLALHIQAVLQGAFILAKSRNDVAIARDMARHLRRYIVLLFQSRDEAVG